MFVELKWTSHEVGNTTGAVRAPKRSGARVHRSLKAQLRSRREIHSVDAFRRTDLEAHNQMDLVAQSSKVVSVLVVVDLEVRIFGGEFEGVC